MTGVQLTMVAMMVCSTYLHITGVSGQQLTESKMSISMDELQQIIMRARQEITDDVMRTTRQEMTDVMKAATVTDRLTEKLEAQNIVNEELTKKLEGQNSIIERLAEMLEAHSAVNEELCKKVEVQNIGIQKLELENVEMKQHIEVQRVQIEGQKVNIEGQKVNIEKFADKQAAMTQQIEDLIAADKRHDDVSQQIAFSVVSRQNFGPVTLDTNVEYEEVHTNIGGGWLPLVDAFQAPIDGVYMFTMSMASHSSSTQNVICNMVHNTLTGQTTVASIRGQSDNYYGDANSVILELAEDDVVSVQLLSGDRILYSVASQPFSTFSGFLIFI